MANEKLLCPSAQPNHTDARVFGVQTASAGQPRRVGYLTETMPVDAAVQAVGGEADPAQVLRIAAPCMHGGCVHHGGGGCSLGARIARMLDPVVGSLPRCAIRPSCVWFAEQGPQACLRCPQVVTNTAEGETLPLEVIYAGGAVPPQ